MKFEQFNSEELNIIKELFNELSYLQIDVNLAYIVESYIYSIVKNDCLYLNSEQFKLEYRVRFDVKDGVCREWYPNGNKKIECSYKCGVKDGIYREWYLNGNKKIECSYKCGVKDGIYREWYSNSGDKLIECTYKNNKYVGKFTSWFCTLDTNGQRNENDNKFTECFYSEDSGKLVGKVINWYENGKISIESCYSNDGKKDGDSKQYNENGELELHYIYKDDHIINIIIDNTQEE